jgi:hypothetical protein
MKNRGFVATIAVVTLMLSTMAFLLTTLSAAVTYADSVSRREYRIQKEYNVRACEDIANFKARKNGLLQGEIFIGEFGCTVQIERDSTGTFQIKVISLTL